MEDRPLTWLPDEGQLLRVGRVAARIMGGRPTFGPGPRPQSHKPGSGLEFISHSSYQPGDELRHLDWRVSSRTRRLQVRRFRDERAARWYVCLDQSSSMAVDNAAKWDLGRQLAGAWAFILLRCGHRVGLLKFTSRLDEVCQPGAGPAQYRRIQQHLQETSPTPTGEDTDPGVCATVLDRQCCAVVISDFLLEAGIEPSLGHLSAACSELHLLQVLSPHEVPEIPTRVVSLRDVETGQTLLVDGAGASRQDAEAALGDVREGLARACGFRGIPYTFCWTTEDWSAVVLNHLIRLARHRA